MRSEGNDPKNVEQTIVFLQHDNAPAHRSVLVTDFLAKKNVTTPEHPSYSPDLAPADFLQWGMLQRTVLIYKIRMLQRTRRNTIGRRSTLVRMMCRAFPL